MSDVKMPDPFVPFNPNTIDAIEEGAPIASVGAANWPVFKHVSTIEQYASAFSTHTPAPGGTEPGSIEAFIKSTIEVAKASPPDMRSFAQMMNIIPDPQAKNVIPWPGMNPAVIKVILEQHLSPKMIIGLRTADVMRYSGPSARPWMPGWQIDTRESGHTPTEQDKTDKKNAVNFLQNCTVDTTDARERDAMGLTSFSVFLETAVRDALSFGNYAWWCDSDLRGRVKSFKCLSAFNIRLATREGYNNDPNIFAIGVDDMNRCTHTFTRSDLIWRPRNPRADASAGGYGLPEVEQAIKIIQGWSDALELNVSTFTKNSIPPGILTTNGLWTQKQIDVISRLFSNLRRGITKAWAMPVIPLPKDGKLEMLSFDMLKDKDVIFGEFLNMLAGALCSVYRFPPDRLGVFTSGKAKDNKPEAPVAAANIDMQDPGLAPELMILENLINEYLIWPRWPGLIFGFTSKAPKDDARAYELRILAMVQDERRAMVDLPKLEDIAAPEDKELARIMGNSPVDPGLVALYSNVVTARIAADTAVKTAAAKPDAGAAFSAKKDPGQSLDHGHQGGVRRDSAAEEKSAEASA